jgi:hypothetical protein
LELEGQSTAHPSAIEWVRTAPIDRDEALQQEKGDLGGRGGLRPDPELAGLRGARRSTVLARLGRGEGEGGRAEGQGSRRVEGRPRR